jgi:hypothetical protein
MAPGRSIWPTATASPAARCSRPAGSLQAQGAAGTGAITFAYGAATTLVIGASDVPGNILSGFLPLDVIDLQGIGTATSAILGAGDILTISGGTATVKLALDPAQNFTGESFSVATDTKAGTLLTASDIAGYFPPSVAGTGTVSGNDHTALTPLAGVTVSDVDPGQTETVTLTLSSTHNGTLSNLAGGTYDGATGSYTVSGSAAAVTAALDGLVFTPTINQVAPGQVVTTGFKLSVTDGLLVSNAQQTTANITALNDPPVISGCPAALSRVTWNVPFNPFPAATVTDPDVAAAETVTLTLSGNGALSLSLPGVTLANPTLGTYTFAAASPAAATTALDALLFTALPDLAVPGFTITDIGISISDGIAPAVTSQVEVLAGLPISLRDSAKPDHRGRAVDQSVQHRLGHRLGWTDHPEHDDHPLRFGQQSCRADRCQRRAVGAQPDAGRCRHAHRDAGSARHRLRGADALLFTPSPSGATR